MRNNPHKLIKSGFPASSPNTAALIEIGPVFHHHVTKVTSSPVYIVCLAKLLPYCSTLPPLTKSCFRRGQLLAECPENTNNSC